jgi:hypothetical protein
MSNALSAGLIVTLFFLLVALGYPRWKRQQREGKAESEPDPPIDR